MAIGDMNSTGEPSSLGVPHRLPPPATVLISHVTPPNSKWYPSWRGKPVFGGNGEALAWALDSMGRAVSFIGSAAFIGTALLRLAKEAAGCETDADPDTGKIPECHERVYGLRPSSFLTTYTVVVGITSAMLMPVVGAIIDTTEKRLDVGKWSTVAFCLLMVPQIAIGEETWFAVALLQLVIAVIGWAQTMVTYAYLPELTSDERILNQYSQSFTTLSFTAMVLYLGFTVSFASIMGWGDLATARFGQSVAVVVTSAFLYVAWYRLLRARPAVRPPPDIPLWKDGFRQVYRTARRINQHWKAVKWYYICVALVDAGVNSLATVAITYLTDVLAFSTQENGIAMIALLLGSIPGGILGGVVTARFNPIISIFSAIGLLLANTIAFGLILEGPGQQMETYLLAAIWGCGTGWKWTTDRLVASTIIPVGQDAELMGTFLFAGQCLTWLPPLLYTALNESGVDAQLSICSLGIWFLMGIFALLAIGDYRKAVVAAGRGYVLERDMEDTGTQMNTGNEQPEEQSSRQQDIKSVPIDGDEVLLDGKE